MNTTPEERAELRKQHPRNANFECWYCNCVKPCPTQRLLDDADESDALRARVEAAEADNAALFEAIMRKTDWNDPADVLRWSNAFAPLASQPHPGDALRERLRAAEERLQRVINAGHNDDCLFCAFKDKAAGLEMKS